MAVKTITIDMAAYEALSRRITTADGAHHDPRKHA
jgi:hypothetical protein